MHLGSSIIEIGPLQANKTETQVAIFEKLHLFGAEELLLRIYFVLHQPTHLVLICDKLVQNRDIFGAKLEKFQEIFGAKSK